MVKFVRPIVMWLEVSITVVTALMAIFAIYQGFSDHDPEHHDAGGFLVLGGFMLAGIAIAFGVGAAGLRMNGRFGWLFQILPLAVLAGWFLR